MTRGRREESGEEGEGEEKEEERHQSEEESGAAGGGEGREKWRKVASLQRIMVYETGQGSRVLSG